jgi:hypothetical protein
MQRKRRIKRGDRVSEASVEEILIERVAEMASRGSAREVMTMLALLDKARGDAPEREALHVSVTRHRAEGSKVQLPLRKPKGSTQ